MKIPSQRGAIALATALVMGSTSAWADSPEFTFKGYGTLAATHADTNLADFRASWRQDHGSRGKVDFGVDSRLGAQVNANFNETFSGAGQILAIRRDGKDKIEVEWLYAQIQAHPEVALRLGRFALPSFMLSDVRTVGYAQHWARTPAEVYLQFPVTSVDGIQLLYRTSWDGYKFTVQPSFGRAKATQYFDAGPLGQLAPDAQFNGLKAVNLSVEKGDWLLRAGQVVNNASLDYHHPWVPFEKFKDTFTSVGLQYDNGDWLLMSEYVDRKTSTDRFDTQSYYLSAGYRWDQIMPYASYSHLKSAGSVIKDNPPATTTALGARWDARQNLAIKFQVESSRLSGQQFTKLDLAASKSERVKVFTVGLDFIF
ncbi:porin [Ideonella sp.]|uniref:porin n=1 Tax=Ideonella sp. TaxID=1929293 RepID=UPI003BB634E1